MLIQTHNGLSLDRGYWQSFLDLNTEHLLTEPKDFFFLNRRIALGWRWEIDDNCDPLPQNLQEFVDPRSIVYVAPNPVSWYPQHLHGKLSSARLKLVLFEWDYRLHEATSLKEYWDRLEVGMSKYIPKDDLPELGIPVKQFNCFGVFELDPTYFLSRLCSIPKEIANDPHLAAFGEIVRVKFKND